MKSKVGLILVLAVIIMAAPTVTQAAGLVPCGGPGEPVCQACYAVDMLSGILDWLIGILTVVFAIIMVSAGMKLVTSAGSTSAKEKAKSMITNAITGFVIVLAAWLMVDYAMKWLVSDDKTEVKLGAWNAVQCAEQPEVTWRLTEIKMTEKQRCFSADDCAKKVAACEKDRDNGSGSVSGSGGNLSVDCSFTRTELTNSDGTGRINPGGRGEAQCAADNTNCSVEYLKSLGLTDTQANVMSCVAVTENAGGSVACSGTGPCGTFQISRTDWRERTEGSSPQVSGCSAANFGGNIKSAQNNASCNAQVMAAMVRSNRGYQPWTGHEKGEKPWNPYAIGCVKTHGNSSDPTYKGF